jgi:O-antigen/teichoic acid export membrane protein
VTRGPLQRSGPGATRATTDSRPVPPRSARPVPPRAAAASDDTPTHPIDVRGPAADPTERLPAADPTERLPVAERTERLPVVVGTGVGEVPAPVPPDGDREGGGRVAGLGDGLALALSSLINSVAGLLGWLIAAQLLATADVGRARQVVTAFMLIGAVAQLNLGMGLLRWIPGAGARTGSLIWRSLLLIMPLSGAVGLVYVLIIPDIARTSSGGGPAALGAVVFVLACAGWGVFVVHDFILVALHRPWWTVWRNALFSGVRIGLLGVLVAFGFGAGGVVLSWVGPIVVWTLAGSLVIVVLARRASREAGDGGSLPTRGAAVRFLGPTAIGQTGAALLYNQVALLVTIRVGFESGAVFFIAWQAVTVIEVAAMFFMNSLAVNQAREPHRAVELAAAARRRLLLIFLPALGLGILVAEPALMIFGPDYATAANVLRLILVGLAFRLIIIHELGVRQASGRAMAYARLQLVSCLLVVLVAGFVPVDGVADPLIAVALGYVAVQVVCAAVVLIFPARRRTEPEVRP